VHLKLLRSPIVNQGNLSCLILFKFSHQHSLQSHNSFIHVEIKPRPLGQGGCQEASSKFVWSQTEVNQIREAVDQLRQLEHRYINGRIKLGVQPSDLARTMGLSKEIILEIQQQIR
jgi:hypothetical protein